MSTTKTQPDGFFLGTYRKGLDVLDGVYAGLGSIGDGIAGIAHSSGDYLKDAAGSAAKLVPSKS